MLTLSVCFNISQNSRRATTVGVQVHSDRFSDTLLVFLTCFGFAFFVVQGYPDLSLSPGVCYGGRGVSWN